MYDRILLCGIELDIVLFFVFFIMLCLNIWTFECLDEFIDLTYDM